MSAFFTRLNLREVPTIVHLTFHWPLHIFRYIHDQYTFAKSVNETANWKVDFKNLEGSEISPYCKLLITSQLATVSWMLKEDMRLLESDSKNYYSQQKQ